MGWWPCPECCGDCVILSDTFDRADDTNLGADWTETAGSWAIVSGQLETSSANAVALATPTPPANNGVSIGVFITGNQNGDLARVIFNYTDANNYNFVEVKFGTGGTVATYERSGGTNTLLASIGATTTLGDPFHLQVCYYDGLIRVNEATTGSSTSLDGGSFGLGTGGTVTGTLKFNTFIARKVSAACDSCEVCEGGCIDTTPGQMEVVAAGIGGAFCAAGNGTFILEGPYCPFANTTSWLYGTGALLNTFPHWELRIADNGGGGSPRRDITLIYRQTSTRNVGFLLQDFIATEGYDCPTISGLSIPFSSSTNCGSVGTPTATLSAL